MSWDHQRYCDGVESEIAAFAAAVADAELTVPVPTCPDWTLGDLVLHTGEVHRWVTAMVADRTERPYRRSDLDHGAPDDLAALPGWLASGAGPLLESLRGGGPETPVWSWGRDQTIGYWGRRMLHETGMHRADAEITLGLPVLFGTPMAVDGVEEYFENLPYAAVFAPGTAELRGAGTIAFLAEDTGWLVQLTPDGFSWHRGYGDATATVAASATDLLLFAYGRLGPGDPGITTTGDDALLNHWVQHSAQ